MTDIPFAGGAGAALPLRSSPGGVFAEGRTLVRLAVPIMLIALVNMGMSVTDSLMVARAFGAEGLAAVAVGSDFHSILFYLGAGVIAGLSPFYSAALARADAAERVRLQRVGLIVVALCGAVLAPVVWTAPDWLDHLGVAPDLLEGGRGYARAIALNLVVMLAVTLYRTILTAAGRPGVFLRVTLAMLPLNAVGNAILMHGLGPIPAFGPTGAGLSSLLVGCASLALVAQASRRALPVGAAAGRVTARDVAAVLRVGLPIGIATLAEVGVFLAATIYAATLGASEAAAHTLALRTAGVAYAIPAALLQAAMVRSAHAEALDDPLLRLNTARAALGLSVICGVAVTGALLGLARPLAEGLLWSGDAGRQAAGLAAGLLVLLAWMELLANPGSAAAGLLRGRRDTRVPMVASLVGYWIVAAPLGLWLSEWHALGATGVWIALAAGTLVTTALNLGRLASRPAASRQPKARP